MPVFTSSEEYWIKQRNEENAEKADAQTKKELTAFFEKLEAVPEEGSANQDVKTFLADINALILEGKKSDEERFTRCFDQKNEATEVSLQKCRESYRKLIAQNGGDALKRKDVKKAVEALGRLETARNTYLLRQTLVEAEEKATRLKAFNDCLKAHNNKMRSCAKAVNDSGYVQMIAPLKGISRLWSVINDAGTAQYKYQQEIEKLEREESDRLKRHEEIVKLDARIKALAGEKKRIEKEQKTRTTESEQLEDLQERMERLQVDFQRLMREIEAEEKNYQAAHEKNLALSPVREELETQIRSSRNAQRWLLESMGLSGEALQHFNTALLYEDDLQQLQGFQRVVNSSVGLGHIRALVSDYNASSGLTVEAYLEGKTNAYMKNPDLTHEERVEFVTAADFLRFVIQKGGTLQWLQHEMSRDADYCKKNVESMLEETKGYQNRHLGEAQSKTKVKLTDTFDQLHILKQEAYKVGQDLKGRMGLSFSYGELEGASNRKLTALKNSDAFAELNRKLSDLLTEHSPIAKSLQMKEAQIPSAYTGEKVLLSEKAEKFLSVLETYHQDVKKAASDRAKALEESLKQNKEETAKKKEEKAGIRQQVKNEFQEKLSPLREKSTELCSKIVKLEELQNNRKALKEEYLKLVRNIGEADILRGETEKAFEKALVSGIRKTLLEKYKTLNDARRTEENSKEYEAMIKPLCDCLGLEIPKYREDLKTKEVASEISLENLIKNLVVMRQNAEKYKAAKEKQMLRAGTAQRHQRLSLVKQLTDLCNDTLDQAAYACRYFQTAAGAAFKDYDALTKGAGLSVSGYRDQNVQHLLKKEDGQQKERDLDLFFDHKLDTLCEQVAEEEEKQEQKVQQGQEKEKESVVPVMRSVL